MNIKILIIEDDHMQNDVLANFLRKESYEAVSVYSLSEARTTMTSDFHLVILDIMLPDGNGLDYLKELREISSVPVIVLTALDDEFTQLNSFDLKADEYVDKPVSPAVMTKRVKALLSRIYEKPSVVSLCGYRFDFQKYQIFGMNHEEIKLTTKEFQIIHLLYKNHGNVVTRDKILDEVWGFEYVGEDRLVDAHIKNIRKKLLPDLIVTVKNVGYRLAI